MKNYFAFSLAVLSLLIAGSGCGNIPLPGKVNLFEGDNAAKAAAKIKDKVGSEQVKVIRAEIRKDTMEITIQSPKNPKDMDTYKFEKGVVSGPVPVRVMSIGNLEMSGEKYTTTDISEIGFAAIPETIKQAISLSNLENARVDLISMDGQRPETGNPQLKEDRKKELDALDKELKGKQAACYKASQPAVCLMDLFPLDQKVRDLRSGNPTDKNKFVLTWRLFVEGPRGRKDFWADKNGKLNEKSF